MYWIIALNFSRILYVRGELADVVLSVLTCTVRTVLTPVSSSRSVTTYGLCIYTVLLLSTMFISHSNSVCTYPSLKQYNTKSYPYYNSDIGHGAVGTWRFLKLPIKNLKTLKNLKKLGRLGRYCCGYQVNPCRPLSWADKRKVSC